VTLKRRVYNLLEADDPPAHLVRAAHLIRGGVLLVIIINVVSLILETVEPFHRRAATAFFAIELVSVAIFTLEYLARLWSITENPRFAHPVRGRLRWMGTLLAIIDLLAIVPFYLPFITTDLRILRLARLFRLVRIARLARYSTAVQMMIATAHERRHELSVSIGLITVLMLISSSLMYYAEHEAQPEVFSSIPAAMWWAIVTLTTVGYGDTYPITAAGRGLAAITAVLGIAMLALPTAILSAGFLEGIRAAPPAAAPGPARCPHCGKPLEVG
jgi:voltage-gated potassium channel